MEASELLKCAMRLANRWPLIGVWLRRGAVARLAADSSDDAVPLLVGALRDEDGRVRAASETALRRLKGGPAIDRLCGLWAEGRDGGLRTLVRECGYAAAGPTKVRVLSSLLTGKAITDADAVPLLVEALEDDDGGIREAAERSLRSLKERDAIDALCQQAISEPAGMAARICIEGRRRPSDPETACLFLFVTRQLEEYFKEDFEFQGLRQAYDRANEAVKALVMDVVRGGDRRCLGFFGRRKPLSECTPDEIRLAVDSALRHEDWPRLFRAFQEMPMRFGFPLIAEFRKSGWEPELADLKALFRGVLAEAGDAPLPPQRPPAKETSSVFERWLAEGRTGEYSRLGEAELLKRLAKAIPPEGVKIVSALASKSAPGGEAAKVVANSGHWLVRLAGHAVGLIVQDLASDEAVKDDNYWINELVRSDGVLDLWPGKATPADLERLDAAPREALLGKYGAVRRVLRLLLAHKITAPEMTEMVFNAGEFSGEFVEA